MPNHAAVRAVVFDFGGVLITSIGNQIGRVADDRGVEVSTMHELLLGPRDSGATHPWHRAERGELAIADIQAELAPWADAVGVELAGDEIDRLLAPGEYTVIDDMVDRVRSLRGAGLQTALLTNTFREFQPTMMRDLDFASFDVVVESFAIGARKPERKIYENTQARLGVSGNDIVYLDDFDQNLVPAVALGWRTIHVTDPTTALDQLDELLP